MNDNDKPMTRDELNAAFDKLIETDWSVKVSDYEQNLETYTRKVVDQLPEKQILFEEGDF